MSTQKKRDAVAALAERIRRCTIGVATDFRSLPVNEMTALRRHLRERSMEYRVVKNRLASLAAKEAGREEFTALLEGTTGIAFGYGDPVEVAKALDGYIKATRSALVVRSAVMEGRVLTGAQVTTIANLPPIRELQAKLLGQLQMPLHRLVSVLSGPLRGLATVLQRRAEQLAA